MNFFGWGELAVGLALIVTGGVLLVFHRHIETRYSRMGGVGNEKSARWVRVGLTVGAGAGLVIIGAFTAIGGVQSMPR